MSYNPVTDFLALLRQTSGGVRVAEIPGLDFVVAALARAGMITLSVGQTAPTTNQPTTVWFKPSLPSWVAEGTVFLWNSATDEYEPATPALWDAVLAPPQYVSGYNFQGAGGATNIILPDTSLLAVERAGPAATALTLPSLASRNLAGNKPLQIADWSTGVANHAITIGTPDGATIMQKATWQLLSTVDQLAGITLYPSTDLNGWTIAP